MMGQSYPQINLKNLQVHREERWSMIQTANSILEFAVYLLAGVPKAELNVRVGRKLG